MKRDISSECRWVSGGERPFCPLALSSRRCHWESRPQERGGIAQAWTTCFRRCSGIKWYGEVPGARSTRDGDTGK